MTQKSILITLDAGELQDLIREAVADALHAHKGAAPAPTQHQLLTRTQLAQALQVSTHHVSHLVKRGMPSLGCGPERRFKLSAVEAWLSHQPAARAIRSLHVRQGARMPDAGHEGNGVDDTFFSPPNGGRE